MAATSMPTLHLIYEAKYSEVALRKRATDVPTNLWSLCGALPGDIELDEPNPIMISRGRLRPSGLWSYLAGFLSTSSGTFTPQSVRCPDQLMYDLAYEEFLQIKACSETELIAENLLSGFSAIQAMLAVKEFATTIGYEVYLYETCDY